jgi:hypothetical protein
VGPETRYIINQRGHNKQKWTMALDRPPRRLQERHGDALLHTSTPSSKEGIFYCRVLVVASSSVGIMIGKEGLSMPLPFHHTTATKATINQTNRSAWMQRRHGHEAATPWSALKDERCIAYAVFECSSQVDFMRAWTRSGSNLIVLADRSFESYRLEYQPTYRQLRWDRIFDTWGSL